MDVEARALRLFRWDTAAALLGGAALRFYRITADALWYDEGYSAWLAGESIPDLVAHTARDIHPPLYYLLLHLWTGLAGSSELALRYFSVFFGLLLIAGAAHLGRKLWGHRAGTLAAMLVALSPFELWYSQEVRMYTLAAALGLVCLSVTAAWGGLITSRFSPRALGAAYVVSAALGLYTLYYFAFLLVCLNLVALGIWLARRMGWGAPPTPSPAPGFIPANPPTEPGTTAGMNPGAGLGALRERAGELRHWLLWQLAALVLFLPWLPQALRQTLTPAVPPWRSFITLGEVARDTWQALALGQSAEFGLVWPYLLLYLLAAGIAVGVLAARREWARLGLLAGALLGPVAIIYLLGYFTPLFHVRYVVTYALPFYLLLALGLAHSWERTPRLSLLLLLTFAGTSLWSAHTYFYDERYAPDDYRGLVARLEESIQPGDAVIIHAGYAYPPVLYYYKGEVGTLARLSGYAPAPDAATRPPAFLQTGSIGGDARLGWGLPESDFYATTEAETIAALERMAATHPRVWLVRVYHTVVDPDNVVDMWLEAHAPRFEDAVFAGGSTMRLRGYATGVPPVTTQTALNLGSVFRSPGYTLHAAEAPDGGAFDVTLPLMPTPDIAQDYRVVLRLTDREGRVWAQADKEMIGRLFKWAMWPEEPTMISARRRPLVHGAKLPVPWETPPGEYTLELGVYRAKDGGFLEFLDEQGRPAGQKRTLGTVRVTAAEEYPAAKTLKMSHPRNDDFGPVWLLGYDAGKRALKPGETLDVDTLWRGGGNRRDLALGLGLRDAAGQLVAEEEQPLAGHGLPVSQWEWKQPVRVKRAYTLPPDLANGEYHLKLWVREPDGRRLGQRAWPWEEARETDLGMLQVAGRERVYKAAPLAIPLGARLGESVVLASYEPAVAQTNPGGSFELRLQWQAKGRMTTSYKVFVQVLNAQNVIVGQRDSLPGDGTLPTTGWLAGEYLTDGYTVPIKPDAPVGEYRVIAGIYDPASGARLPAFDAAGKPVGDFVELGTVRVAP